MTFNKTDFSGFADLILDAVCVVDEAGYFVYLSAACERIFGYRSDELIGTPMIALVFPEDRERTLNAAAEIMSGHPNLHFENRYVRKGGGIVHIMWTARWSEKDRLRIAVARDITEYKRTESVQTALHMISEAAHAAGDLPELIARLRDIVGMLLPFVSFAVAVCDEKNGRPAFPCQRDSACFDLQVLAAGAFCAERHGRPSSAAELAVDGNILMMPLHSERGPVGAMLLATDGAGNYVERDGELLSPLAGRIAEAIECKRQQERLQHTAQYDELTDLPNRRLLHDRLETALIRARRNRDCMALLYLDLDRFKEINDSYGHAAGDVLLREAADRLKHCVRDADTVARIGGDEFIVLLEGLHAREEAARVADKIRAALQRPVSVNDDVLTISPSIGIAFYPEHGEEAQALLHHADAAMYAVKHAARSLGGQSADCPPMASDGR
ncbi:GGDEF domain-containing protein [Oxalicibacterium solurbis]|nr:GGDEF domain-containing protein [Oxalicibacterium solurbis]